MPLSPAKLTLAAATLLLAGPCWSQNDAWTGRYVGFGAGAATGKTDMTFNPTGTFVTGAAGDIADGNFWRGTRELETTSVTASAYVGHQVRRDRMVYGVEGEAGYLRLNDASSVRALVPATGSTYQLDQQIKTDFFAALRGRLGYLPEGFSDKLMLFGTAGLTLTHARIDQRFTQINVIYDSNGLSENRYLLGWTVGGGFEYTLSKNWNLRAEYLYANLGKVDKNAIGNPAVFSAYTTANKAEPTAHIARIGASWRF
jgi:outer membrane immunogenic protein